MENREGILDEIEELVSDFQSTKKLKEIPLKNFIRDFISVPYQPYHESFLNQLERRDRFREEEKIDHNRKVPYYCPCGVRYVLFINEHPVDRFPIYPLNPGTPNTNIKEKRFYCMKCGAMSYIRKLTDFEIVVIKHDENFII